MTKGIQLVTQDGSSTVDLYDGTLIYRMDSWRTQTDADGMIVESMELVCRNQSDANIVTAEDALEEMKFKAERWHSNVFRADSVWLQVQHSAEETKRSLVRSIDVKPVARGLYAPYLGATALFLDAAITRYPWYEDDPDIIGGSISTAGVSSLGGTIRYNAISGDLPARIRTTRLDAVNGTAIVNIDSYWIGIRPTNEGVSGFVPLWELELGSVTGPDASVVADSAASGGSAVKVTFAGTATMEPRTFMEIQQVPGYNSDHMIGEYLVLNRVKVDTGSTVNIYMKHGFGGGLSFAPSEIYYGFDDPNYRLIELGFVSVPPYGNRIETTPFDVKRFQLHFCAERVGGTGSLYLDCAILIPSGYIAKSSAGGVAYPTTRWITNEDYSFAAFCESVENNPAAFVHLETSPDAWGLPIEGGVIVLAGEQGTVSVKDDTISAIFNYTQRYRMFKRT